MASAPRPCQRLDLSNNRRSLGAAAALCERGAIIAAMWLGKQRGQLIRKRSGRVPDLGDSAGLSEILEAGGEDGRRFRLFSERLNRQLGHARHRWQIHHLRMRAGSAANVPQASAVAMNAPAALPP